MAASSYALDPSRTLNQYVHERWGAAQGLPNGKVNSIAQTADGYLWIGSEAGLYRFDGTTFTVVGGAQAATDDEVLGLQAEPDGSLWIQRADPSLTRYQNGLFTAIQDVTGDEDPRVTATTRDNQSHLIFASRRAGTALWTGKQFLSLQQARLIPQSPVISIVRAKDGSLWLGTREAGVAHFVDNSIKYLRDGLPSPRVTTLLSTRAGQLFVGTDKGLVRLDGERFVQQGIPKLIQRCSILALLEDRDDNIWAGTENSGLIRIAPDASSEQEASPGRSINSLFEDREGDIWLGDDAGLERLQESAFSNQAVAGGNGGPICVDTLGRIWFAPVTGGLRWLDKSGIHAVRSWGLDSEVVYSLARSKNGLWVGRQHEGITELRFSGQLIKGPSSDFHNVRKDGPSLPDDMVYTVRGASDGSVWAGTVNSGVCRVETKRATCFAKENGLASNTVLAIAQSQEGAFWFGTSEGLSRYWKGTWKTYGIEDGLPSPSVYALLFDKRKNLWIGTTKGLTVLRSDRVIPVNIPSIHGPVYGIAQDNSGRLWVVTPKQVMSLAIADEPAEGFDDLREYTPADGLSDMQGVRRDMSILVDHSGRILISRSFGFSVVDPGRVARNSAPAIVHISSIAVDGNTLGVAQRLRIPPSPGRIVISYEGLNLRSPSRIRYRYKLDGLDTNWSPVFLSREAVYTKLGPGSYRFHVISSNGEGSWNGTESSLAFEVAPALWQTVWFRGLVIITVLLASIFAYRLRVRQMTETVNIRFDERLAERTRLARELHDTLLQTIQGSKMVAEDALELRGAAPDPIRMHAALEKLSKWLNQAVEEGRRALNSLRTTSASDNDLQTALQQVAEDCAAPVGIKINFAQEGKTTYIQPLIRDEIYRIAYEAIRNACRHSACKKLEIELSYTKNFVLRVRDDGKGISAEIAAQGRAGHFGLIGMQERAQRVGGKLSLFSSHHLGTEVELIVPGNIAFHKKRDGFAI